MGVALVAAGLGGALGAFTPVLVYRLSVAYGQAPLSACGHCGRALPWAGPWCPGCRRRLGPQWWFTGTVAALAAGVLALSFPDGPPATVVALTVILALLGTVLGAIDVSCRRLPSAIVLPSIVAGAVALVAVSAGTGEWGSLGRAALGALALGVVYLVLYALPGGNLGFGDVQLAVLLGLLLGYRGWSELFWGGVALPWLVNVPVLVTLLLLGRVGRRSRVPFGPSMLAGAVLGVALATTLSS